MLPFKTIIFILFFYVFSPMTCQELESQNHLSIQDGKYMYNCTSRTNVQTVWYRYHSIAITARTGIHIIIDATNYTNTQELIYYNETVLPSYSQSTIYINNLRTDNIGFAIVQIHSFEYNVTLSYNQTIERNYNENGTNLGLTLYPTDFRAGHALVYVHNLNYFTGINASIVLMIYNRTTPVPGGCNMEYPVPDAPILMLKSMAEFLYVDTPLAADDPLNDNRILCNSTLSYVGYHMYLPRNDYSCRTYFDGIKSMLTAESVVKQGQLVS